MYTLNDDAFKVDLYLNRIRDFSKIQAGTSKVSRIWVLKDCDAEVIAELCGEHRVPVLTPLKFAKLV